MLSIIHEFWDDIKPTWLSYVQQDFLLAVKETENMLFQFRIMKTQMKKSYRKVLLNPLN